MEEKLMKKFHCPQPVTMRRQLHMIKIVVKCTTSKNRKLILTSCVGDASNSSANRKQKSWEFQKSQS